MDNLFLSNIINKLENRKQLTSEEIRKNNEAIKKMNECGLNATANYNIEIRDLIQGKSGYDYSYKDLKFDKNPTLNTLLGNCTLIENCVQDAIIPYFNYGSAYWGLSAGQSFQNIEDVRFGIKRVSNNITLSKSYSRQQTKAFEEYLTNALLQSLLEKTFSTLFKDEENHDISGVFPLFNTGNTVEISTLDDVLNLKKDVDLESNDNFFICSPTAQLKLRKLGAIDNGLILDSPTIFTNLVQDGFVCYISLKNLALCLYDVIGITVDPYSKAKDNQTIITVEAYIDARLLYHKLMKVGKFVEPSDEPTGDDEPTTEPTNGDEPTNDGE
jgi:hypothetical protein